MAKKETTKPTEKSQKQNLKEHKRSSDSGNKTRKGTGPRDKK